MEINDILAEWSYRLKKGYPTMKDGKFTDPAELEVLHEILKENGINEMPSFVSSKTPVSDIVREDVAKILTEARSVEDIVDLVNNLELDPKQVTKLYDRIKTFMTYRPVKKTLEDKGVHPKVLKTFTTQIQTLIEDLPEGSVNKFIGFLNQRGKRKKPILWPTDNRRGNLFQGEGAVPSAVAPEMAKQLAKHTGQDEKKRGVGQAELLMSLVYDNITVPMKGDLSIVKNIGDEGGVEFEVKGNKAILGNLGRPISDKLQSFFEEFSYFGINYDAASKFQVQGGGKLRLNQMCLALAIAVRNSKDPEFAKQHPNGFKRIQDFINGVVVSANEQPTPTQWINWDETDEEVLANDINKAFGLSNFMRYGFKEKFGFFGVFDYGNSGIGLPVNQGDYIFVGGSIEDQAKELWDRNVAFNPATPNAPGPRIEAGPVTDSIFTGTLNEHLEALEEQEELDY